MIHAISEDILAFMKNQGKLLLNHVTWLRWIETGNTQDAVVQEQVLDLLFQKLPMKVASKRIKDAEDTEAEILVTSCSFCILNLENALEKPVDESNIENIDKDNRSAIRGY